MLEYGHLEDAIAVMLPVVTHYYETGDLYGNFQSRINLAALYHLNGNHEQRDQALARAVYSVQFAIDHGWDMWAAYYNLAMAAAARGSATEALEYLQQAYDRGFRALWWIETDYGWNPIRETPEFQAMVERIRADNAAMLEEIRAARGD